MLYPYISWKNSNSVYDFNDLAIELACSQIPPERWDILVVDEAQDLSANEVRALLRCKAESSSITFVLDSAQRIYAKGFSWSEVGITLSSSQSFKLKTNHRNTRQIAEFILPILEGVDLGDEDGSLPPI